MARKGEMDFSISQYAILSSLCRARGLMTLNEIAEAVYGSVDEESSRKLLLRLHNQGLVKQGKKLVNSKAGRRLQRLSYRCTQKGVRDYKKWNTMWGRFFD